MRIGKRKRRLIIPDFIVWSGGLSYAQKVLTIAPANLIGYWRLNETSGTNADDSSSQNNDGTYTGVDLANAAGPDGVKVPYFDGTNDYCNIYSAAFNSDFNGQSGTMAIWCKVNAAAVWTDAAFRKSFFVGVDVSTNYVNIDKRATNNEMIFEYKAGGVLKSVSLTISSTAWFHLAVTWNLSGDQMIAYLNGTQTGSTQTGLGTWAGSLDALFCNIGARATTPVQVWHGWLAHAALWNTPLTPAQILSLATV